MSAPRSPRRPGAPAETSDPLAYPPFTRARRMRAELVTAILRSGRSVSDDAFDDIYPEAVKRASSAHWTPVRVCARAVALLRLGPGDRLLDIGAGAGKFCIVAGAMSPARVRGVERQPELAAVASEAAHRLGVDVEIVHGELDAEDPMRFDAGYLFNPFTEAMLLPGVDVPADRFAARAALDIATAERFLDGARPGVRIVTYCGFGGSVPSGYERLAFEVWEGGALELWEKRSVREPP